MNKWLFHTLILFSLLQFAGCQSPATNLTQTVTSTLPSAPSLTSTQTQTAIPPTVAAIASPTIPATPTQEFTPTALPTPTFVTKNSFAVGFSVDGSLLAFNSSVDGLVAGDNNHKEDPFIYHTRDGRIEGVSIVPGGKLYQSYPGQAASLSANGRYLLYTPFYDNQVPGDKNFNYAYLRDLKTGKIYQLDFSRQSKELKAPISRGYLSADGRFLALEASYDTWHLLLYERGTGKVIDLSLSPEGQPANGYVFQSTFSTDGRFLAFVSNASNLAPDSRTCTDAEPTCGDVFLYNIAARKLERIPAHLCFVMGCPYPYLTISNNARWLAWTEAEGPTYRPVVRLYDRTTGKMETVCAGAAPACTGHSPSISADGRWLAFATIPESRPDGSWDVSKPAQIYLRDRQTGSLTLVSQGADGQPGDDNSGIILLQSEGWSSDVRISGDGRLVAFSSQSTNLLPVGTEKQQCFNSALAGAYPCYDLFVYDRLTKKLSWISQPKPGLALQPAAAPAVPLDTPLANTFGLTIEENQIVGKPIADDPLAFQPLHGSQQAVMGRHAKAMRPPYSFQQDFANNELVMTAVGDNRFKAIETFINDADVSRANIRLEQDGTKIFESRGWYAGPVNILRGLWIDHSGWTLEISITPDANTPATGLIYQKYVGLLNQKYGYTEMFGYQLLDGKPFYFYQQRDGRIHLSYDGQDLPLFYDQIPHYGCCSSVELNPRSGPNWLTFLGLRAGTWYYVQIGRYE